MGRNVSGVPVACIITTARKHRNFYEIQGSKHKPFLHVVQTATDKPQGQVTSNITGLEKHVQAVGILAASIAGGIRDDRRLVNPCLKCLAQ